MHYKFFKISVTVLFAGVLLSFTSYINPGETIHGDNPQALRGFEYLKKVRKDPNSYTERLHVSLKEVAAAPVLHWNDTLAAVAENRALDMAQQGYFGHTDKAGYGINYYINKAGYKLDDAYLKKNKADDFEAIIAGQQSGENALAAMIMDNDESDLASRKLLLAMTDFSKGLSDIGIGFVHGTKDTKFRYYTVVIIAKRKA
ncbi:MAG TPA: CAP domain-containing protein [Bacteroidia bacterium]|jgi:hypothetical protein|nr:CAP domain-containing protein [Bacteroidia bacterium]